ncbi:hypothetical protein [Spiroplasma endosymbiont of Polydrusus pterygomalis]|uniref:hypothetical protein n=1 Tax=Spiroplasma endosymbiont of Polydrusus pterygomalis TaxID=3139327 RepID=UPI003CCB28C5
MYKPHTISKTWLQTNVFAIQSKRLNLEIIIDHSQQDGINVQHSLYNCSKLTSSSEQLQAFFKNAYYKAVATNKFYIPWKIKATLNLPKFQIVENKLLDSTKTTATINDLKNTIIKESIIIKNNETNFEVKLSLKEICENFHIENPTLNQLLNDCLKINNNFEKVKKESNLVANKEDKNYHYHSLYNYKL